MKILVKTNDGMWKVRVLSMRAEDSFTGEMIDFAPSFIPSASTCSLNSEDEYIKCVRAITAVKATIAKQKQLIANR
jgi:hypothetical protein